MSKFGQLQTRARSLGYSRERRPTSTVVQRGLGLTPVAMQCKMHCMAREPADAQMTFRLPRSIAARLDEIAARRGVQRSDLLREAAARVVSEEEARERPFELVKDLVGSLDSRVPDLGSEHRKYLAKGFGRRRGR